MKADELKAVEKALANKIYNRILDSQRPAYGGYQVYYPPSHYPLSDVLYESVVGLLGYHDIVDRIYLENRVIDHVTDPAMSEILGIMYDIVHK